MSSERALSTVDDDTSREVATDGGVAESSASETGGTDETDLSWPAQYLQDHLVHVAVVVLLAAYPGIYAVLVNSPLGAEMTAILPQVTTMVTVFYFALFAMSFDFVSGYTGYLSFGHAAFYGAGAYAVVLAANGKVPLVGPETPFMLLLVVAGLIAALLALLIGAVSFRLTGVYFAMITLGFSQVLYVFVRDWDYVGSNPRDGVAVPGGVSGFEVGVPGVDALNLAIGRLAGDSVALGFVEFTGTGVSYYMVGLVVLVCYFAMQRIIHSPFGRVLIAIRENEERAKAVGYNTFRYKLGAFAVSAFFAGIAGGLLAGFKRSVAPEGTFYFLVAGDALLASIIGGFGTLAGPLFGRLFDESVREFLSKSGEGGGLLPWLRDTLGDGVLATEIYNGLTVGGTIETFLNGHAALYVGIVFVLFVLYVPDGLLGTVRQRVGGPVGKHLPAHLQRYLR